MNASKYRVVTTVGAVYKKTLLATIAAVCLSGTAQAGLFDDNEAREAILELRQETEANRINLANLMEQLQSLHGSNLDLQNQIEALKVELNTERGQREELQQKLTVMEEAQVKEREAAQKREAALQTKLDNQPVIVTVDGVKFETTGAEKEAFDEALAAYRSGDQNGMLMQLVDFEQRFPKSQYIPSVKIAQGNAYFVQKEYNSAIKYFREVISRFSNHPAAPESALSIANIQIAMGRQIDAKKTLKDLITVYPDTEAAATAKQRLSEM